MKKRLLKIIPTIGAVDWRSLKKMAKGAVVVVVAAVQVVVPVPAQALRVVDQVVALAVQAVVVLPVADQVVALAVPVVEQVEAVPVAVAVVRVVPAAGPAL